MLKRKAAVISAACGALAMIVLCASGPSLAAPIEGPSKHPLAHYAAAGKLSPSVLTQLDLTGEAEILVVFDDRDVDDTARRLRESRHARFDDDEIIAEKSRLHRQKKAAVIAALGDRDYRLVTDYDHFPIMHLTVIGDTLAKLLNMEGVAYIDENRATSHQLTESLPLIGAPQVQAGGATGTGTAVAVLDTGVNYTRSAFGPCTAPATPLACKVAYAHDFASDDGSLDDDGHGTNVAGIVVGVAPGTKILALDVFRTNGYAYYSDILSALNWVLSTRSTYNTVAVNMSLGGGRYTAPCPSDGLASAITSLKNAGITTVIASGNDGYTDSISAPACNPSAVSVGAVYDASLGRMSWSACTDRSTAADKVTCFSNSASFLTLLAPGAMITAAGSTMAGTSQATPHVAGAVAVTKGQYAAISVDNVIATLKASGKPVTDARNNLVKPRLDLNGALHKPKISSTPSSQAFGSVLVGETSAAAGIRVDNAGFDTLVINDVAFSGPAAAEFHLRSDTCTGRSLPPAGSCTVEIVLSPQSAGAKGGTLDIPSNDPFTPSLAVPLTGSGIIPVELTVIKTGTGSGTIISIPEGITCGTSCTHPFLPGTVVTLTAGAAPDSVFTGWSGGGCGGTGTCNLTESSATTVSVTFTLDKFARILRTIPLYYSNLQTAYHAAVSGDTIQSLNAVFTEELNISRNIEVTIRGGYDVNYWDNASSSVVRGSLTVTDGSLSVENLVIQ